MPNLNTDEITAAEIAEFANSRSSDFAFEVSVLRMLIRLDYVCDHSGTYQDDATNKRRQYDIRAQKTHGLTTLRLLVECKNLRAHYPLLVSCMPRSDRESHHEVIISHGKTGSPNYHSVRRGHVFSSRKTGSTLYPVGQPVGKSCEQVRRKSAKELDGDDRDMYDKWTQALSSANDVVNDASNDANTLGKDYAISLVLPIVVVPDGRLWMKEYDQDGASIAAPVQVHRCSFLMNRKYPATPCRSSDYTISHVEFMTSTGLEDFASQFKNMSDFQKNAFLADAVRRRMTGQ